MRSVIISQDHGNKRVFHSTPLKCCLQRLQDHGCSQRQRFGVCKDTDDCHEKIPFKSIHLEA